MFKEVELDATLVCAKFAHTKEYGCRKGFVQQTETTLYNLDVIISVGYRVKSQRGTQFRIWANKVLREYLVKGYAINNKIAAQKYEELSQLVKILGRTVKAQERLTDEDSRSLLNVVVDYNYALDTLDKYDYQQLAVEKTTKDETLHATYENAMASMLLYLVTPNHSFSDGNKRIAATLFLWFMASNGILYHSDGSCIDFAILHVKTSLPKTTFLSQ